MKVCVGGTSLYLNNPELHSTWDYVNTKEPLDYPLVDIFGGKIKNSGIPCPNGCRTVGRNPTRTKSYIDRERRFYYCTNCKNHYFVTIYHEFHSGKFKKRAIKCHT